MTSYRLDKKFSKRLEQINLEENEESTEQLESTPSDVYQEEEVPIEEDEEEYFEVKTKKWSKLKKINNCTKEN